MYKSLQILRAVAAWMVVFFHYNQSLHNHKVENFVAQFISEFGEIGVDIFFVLSGFVMAVTAPKYLGKGIEYGINRIIRIVPNYWFYTLILVVCIKWLPEHSYLTDWSKHALKESLLLIPGLNQSGSGFFPILYVGWTLIYEMFFYMTLAGCLLFYNPKPLLTCSLILFMIPLTPLKEFVFLGRGHLYLWEFLSGFLICQLFNRFPQQNLRLIISTAGLLGLIIYSMVYGDNFYSRMWASALLVYFVVCQESFFQTNHWLIRFFVRLGDYSYSTYLCHVIVLGWFVAAFGFRPEPLDEIIVFFGATLIIYIFSSLTYHLIETGPLPKIFRSIALLVCSPITTIIGKLNLWLKITVLKSCN